MKTIINQIISLRSRVSRRDVVAIYTCALIDIALTACLIGGVLFIVLF